ncbi:MAG TPA: 2-phospho-L-lactate guanylyltransferase [Actinomycetes bacterium]|nr:2-phospho-L-lactate guanylyltransferase [Actinomycetes bacterium]
MLAPVIPVKRLAAAKGRLAPDLHPVERRVLAIAMFEDVVAAVQATTGLAAPVVVSPDREVWRRAEALRCRVVEEDGDGDLNAAVRRATPAAGDQARGVAVVAADLPLATPDALGRVRDALAAAPVVVVPSADGGGTNVLGWRPPARFEPRFGPGSAGRHAALPGALRLELPELALDVDTPADLRAVLGRLDPGTVTARRARDLGLAARLAAGLQPDRGRPD